MLGSSFSSAVRKILKVIPFFYCHLEFSFPNERLPKILHNLIINIGYFWLFYGHYENNVSHLFMLNMFQSFS